MWCYSSAMTDEISPSKVLQTAEWKSIQEKRNALQNKSNLDNSQFENVCKLHFNGRHLNKDENLFAFHVSFVVVFSPYQSEACRAWNRMQEQKSMNTLRGLSQSAVKLLKGYKINRTCWTTNWTKMHYIQCSNGKLWNRYRYGKRKQYIIPNHYT